MIFYAIKHVSSGLFLPAGGKGRSGHTKQDPDGDRPPRLFPTLKAAHLAHKAYIKGIWMQENIGWRDDHMTLTRPKYGTGRSPLHYVIVKVIVSEAKDEI